MTALLSRGRLSPCAHRRHGFTLIELLVVVAIAGLLAALAFPALFRGLEEGRSAKCLSNLRQLAVAGLAYSGDHDGLLIPVVTGTVPGVTFRAYLVPYLGGGTNLANVFRCPSSKMDENARFDATGGLSPSSYGIAMTYYSSGGRTLPYPGMHDYYGSIMGHRMIAIPRPSETVFLCDVGLPDNVGLPPARWTEKQRGARSADLGYAKMPNVWASQDWAIYPRHAGGRSNVAFYDGHCASLGMTGDLVAHPPGDPLCLYDYH